MFEAIMLVVYFIIFSCASSLNVPKKKNFNFVEAKKYFLSLDDIQIIDKYNVPFAKPYLDHLLKESPNFLVKKWIDKCLLPKGNDSVLQVIMNEGSIIEKNYNKLYQYDINIDIDLVLLEGQSLQELKPRQKVVLTKTALSETRQHPKSNYAFFDGMLEDLLKDLEKQTKEIFEYFLII